MRHLGGIKADTWVLILNCVGAPAILLYLYAMLLKPWLVPNVDSWIYVQEVWSRWQTFNASVVAFISSLIAFNINRYNERKQREREFVAAKALLPHSLSELTKYFKDSSIFLKNLWDQFETNPNTRPTVQVLLPTLPETCQSIFSDCIKYAEPDVGEYLADVLSGLQIHNARLSDLNATLSNPQPTMIVLQQNVMSYLYSLGRLQAMINRLFGFARSSEPFRGDALTYEEFHTAYSATFDLWPEDIGDLVGFTKRAISRGH
jgi:hypothetical protein